MHRLILILGSLLSLKRWSNCAVRPGWSIGARFHLIFFENSKETALATKSLVRLRIGAGHEIRLLYRLLCVSRMGRGQSEKGTDGEVSSKGRHAKLRRSR